MMVSGAEIAVQELAHPMLIVLVGSSATRTIQISVKNVILRAVLTRTTPSSAIKPPVAVLAVMGAMMVSGATMVSGAMMVSGATMVSGAMMVMLLLLVITHYMA
jgi:hypothetical protein